MGLPSDLEGFNGGFQDVVAQPFDAALVSKPYVSPHDFGNPDTKYVIRPGDGIEVPLDEVEVTIIALGEGISDAIREARERAHRPKPAHTISLIGGVRVTAALAEGFTNAGAEKLGLPFVSTVTSAARERITNAKNIPIIVGAALVAGVSAVVAETRGTFEKRQINLDDQ